MQQSDAASPQRASISTMSEHHSGQLDDALADGDSDLDLRDLVDVIETDTPVEDFTLPEQLHVLSPTAADRPVDRTGGDDMHEVEHTASFVVALFCDGFVCRHWTAKSGWVEGFAQSYDATSRYFLESLERESLPDGLLELMEEKNAQSELIAEIWDLRSHPTALCPLTSADLPRSAPTKSVGGEFDVRQVILRRREQVIVNNADAKDTIVHSPDDQFPQLSSNDLEELTNDELASLALSSDSDLMEVEVEFAILEDEGEVEVAEAASSEIVPQATVRSPTTDYTVHATRQISIDAAPIDGGDVNELITPKRSVDTNALWSSSCLTSPTAFLSPTESKSMQFKPLLSGEKSEFEYGLHLWNDTYVAIGCGVPPAKRAFSQDTDDESGGTANTSKRAPHWVVKEEPIDSAVPDSLNGGNTLHQSIVEGATESTLKLRLSQSSFQWTQLPANKPKQKKKKNRLELKPSSDSTTPLPATHQFLTKLKGKRPRNYTIDELSNSSPAWMMMKHMNKFYQAALLFERRHSHFLQVNVERIMKADPSAREPAKLVAGSMNYLATQLQQLQRPDQVIAAAAARKELDSLDDAVARVRVHSKSPRVPATKLTEKRAPSTASIMTPPMTPERQVPWSPASSAHSEHTARQRSPVPPSLPSVCDTSQSALQFFDAMDEETFEF